MYSIKMNEKIHSIQINETNFNTLLIEKKNKSSMVNIKIHLI